MVMVLVYVKNVKKINIKHSETGIIANNVNNTICNNNIIEFSTHNAFVFDNLFKLKLLNNIETVTIVIDSFYPFFSDSRDKEQFNNLFTSNAIEKNLFAIRTKYK